MKRKQSDISYSGYERALTKEYDVFQFGICLWQMLHNGTKILQSARKKRSIPKEIQFLTIDCLSKDPEQRPTIYYIKHTLLTIRDQMFSKI